MKRKILAIALLGSLGLCIGVAQAATPQTLIARTNVNGMTRLQAHHVLTQYCKDHGFGIVHDSLSSMACRKRLDGAPKSYLAEQPNTNIEPYTPSLTLHFRFVPNTAGVMRIKATGSVVRQGPNGYAEHGLVPVNDVQHMLSTSRAYWYQRHPEFAPRA